MTGPKNLSFKYNAAGLRTEKTVDGVTTTYRWVGDKVTHETNGTGTFLYYYDAEGKLVSFNLDGTDYFYVRNGQGDITGILNGAGTQVVTYVHDSWGKLVSTTGTLATTAGLKNPYRYRGYRYDTETGLYYLQSRYYNPEWRRFLNADGTEVLGASPMELTDKNLFAYCDNNPVMRADEGGELFRVVTNFVRGQQWNDGLSSAAMSGAASGFLAATGAGLLGQIAAAVPSYWAFCRGNRQLHSPPNERRRLHNTSLQRICP